MEGLATVIQPQVFSEDEFAVALQEIKGCIKQVSENLARMADLFSRMSKPQLKKAKQELSVYMSADRIERLVLFGRELIPQYLACKDKTVPVSFLKSMKPEVRKEICDPQKQVTVITDTGPKIKTLEALTGFEFAQVVDKRDGIRSVDKQLSYKNNIIKKGCVVNQNVTQSLVNKLGQAEEPVKINLVNNYLLLETTQGLMIKIKVSEMRKLFR